MIDYTLNLMGKIFTKCKIYLLVLFFSIPAIFSLFTPGLPPTHDGEYHVVRFYEFDKVLRSGVFYPVWAPDLNYTYGSPLFLYVYPFPNYVSSALHFLGFSFIDAFKLNLIIASILGSLFMYAYGNYKFGRWGGLISAVAYTYAPYHLLDIYVRGSVGEVWALALFPAFLYFFDKGIDRKNLKQALYAGIVFSVIILSHNILSVMFLGFLCFYSFFQISIRKQKLKNVQFILVSLFSGIGLSSFFILPALFKQGYTVGLKVFSVFDHFPEVYQLLIPSWGSGYSGISNGTQMSFQIGVANLIIFALTVFALLRRKRSIAQRAYIVFFLSMFLFFVFLVTPFSKIIWERLAFIQIFQFPWRFLSLVVFCASILAGGLTIFYKSKILHIGIIVIIIFTTIGYAKAPFFHLRNDEYYIKSENFIYGTNSIGNVFQTKWFPQAKHLPDSAAKLLLAGENVSPVVHLPNRQEYSLSLDTPDSLLFNTAFFPGWRLKVDNQYVDIINAKGLMRVDLDSGNHYIELEFNDTFVEIFAKVVSVLSALIILLIIFKKSDTIKS